MQIELIYHSIYAIILESLSYLFITHGIRKKRVTGAVFLSILFGFLSEIISIILEFILEQNLLESILFAFQVCFSSLQIIFWYIHLERLESLRIKYLRYGLILTFFIVSIFSVFLTVIFYEYPSVVLILWMFSDFGYISLAVITFGIVGSFISFKSYRNTLDRQQLFFFWSYVLIGIGAITIAIGVLRDFIELGDIYYIFENLFYIGNIIVIFGQFLLLAIYFYDLNYVYRLPFDVYLLLTFQKHSGNLTSAVWLKTTKKLELDVYLVSGMLTAMNGIFGDIFNDNRNIQEIKGMDANLLFEIGEEMISVVICQETSYYLVQSLKGYLKAFEKKYHNSKNGNNLNIQKIEETKDLVLQYFPYCEIDKEKQEKGTELLRSISKDIEDRFKKLF